MQREQQSGTSLAETQFYARTSHTPVSKRHGLIFQKSDEIYSTPPLDKKFPHTIEDQLIDDKSKNIYISIFHPTTI